MLFNSGAFSALKAGVTGLALAGGLAIASAAGATSVVITKGVMTNPLIVTLGGGVGYQGDVYDAPMQFTTIYGGQANVDLLAFCVDVYHDINFGNPYSPSLQYTDVNAFHTDSALPTPHELSADVIHQVGQLVNYGTLVFGDGGLSAAQKSFTLAAVQGAIWQTVSGDTVQLSTGYGQGGLDKAGFDALVGHLSDTASYKSYIGGYGFVPDHVTFITPLDYPNRGATQSFLFASPTPEPGAWALMIGGFGLAGAMLRRRRAAAAA